MKTSLTVYNKNKQIKIFSDQENEYIKELVRILFCALLET